MNVTPKLYHVASDFLAAVCPKEYDLEGNLIGDKAATVIFDCTKLKRAVPGFLATTRFDEGEILESYTLSHEDGQYGVDIPKNVWHGLECIEPAVLLE